MITNADAAKALIDSQAEKGRAHYGIGLEAAEKTVSELAHDASEEAADLLAYLVALKQRALALEAENVSLRAQLAALADS